MLIPVLGTLPKEPIPTHPAHKYPKYIQAINEIPTVMKSTQDLQTGRSPRAMSNANAHNVALSKLPLRAVSAVLTAIDTDPEDLVTGGKAIDAAGYESVSISYVGMLFLH